MTRKFAALLPLALVAALGGCEVAPSPQGLTTPAVDAPALNTQGTTYTLVQGRLPSQVGELSISRLIGVEGGSITLAGHSIEVPAGAVAQPTVFTLALATNGLVEVDLTAVVVDLLGKRTDVGAAGFAPGKPVKLTLSYASASNVTDAGRLVILHRRDDGTVKELPSTVDRASRTVTALLEHFSRYCLATN